MKPLKRFRANSAFCGNCLGGLEWQEIREHFQSADKRYLTLPAKSCKPKEVVIESEVFNLN